MTVLTTVDHGVGSHPVDARSTRPFRRVVVVVNPHSSGDGPGNARRLADGLADLAPGLPVELVRTRCPGHAVHLARTASSSATATLVVSASGDGGYHEVVNGVLQAVTDGHRNSFAAVLPSGNANDHASLSRRPLVEAIAAGDVTRLDVLAFEVEGQPVSYAHSYIGLGLSPVVVDDINRHPTTRAGEVWSVLSSVPHFQPPRVSRDGAVVDVGSLLFANIDRMGKHLALSRTGSVADGRFEVLLTVADRGRTTLAVDLLRALTGHLSPPSRSTPFAFTLVRAAPVQLDGEVVHLPAGARITVSCQPGALACVR